MLPLEQLDQALGKAINAGCVVEISFIRSPDTADPFNQFNFASLKLKFNGGNIVGSGYQIADECKFSSAIPEMCEFVNYQLNKKSHVAV